MNSHCYYKATLIVIGVFLTTLAIADDDSIVINKSDGVNSSPANVAEDVTFTSCVNNNNCGIEDKCSFELHGIKNQILKHDNNNNNNNNNNLNTNSSAPSIDNKNDPITVRGHLIVIKNHMPYSIIFYWYIIGDHSNSRDQYHGILAHPKTFTYIDTKRYGPQRIGLAVSKVGNDPELLNKQPTLETSETIQTFLTGGEECTKYQACKLLNNVCYMASNNNVDCENYRSVCNNFDDGDQLAKDSCIPECLYTYWPDRMTTFQEIDSEQVVEWISRGGGIKGSNVNGLCNTEVITGLIVTIIILILAIITMLCTAFKYRKSLRAFDLNTSSRSNRDNNGNDGFNNQSDDGYL